MVHGTSRYTLYSSLRLTISHPRISPDPPVCCRYEGFSVNETVLVDAKGLEAFVDVVGDEASEATQIIEPFAFGVRLNRQSEGEKLLTMDLLLDMHRIDARVAFHDVMLVLFIVNGLSDAATRVSAGEPQPATTSPSRMGSTVSVGPMRLRKQL